METLTPSNPVTAVITPGELLTYWLGHRKLTRKLIEAFPEKEFFEYSIGGMRPCSQLIQEMLDVSGGGVREMAGGEAGIIAGHAVHAENKADMLAAWDQNTSELSDNLGKIPVEKFHDKILSFGQYEVRYGKTSIIL